MNNLVLLQGLVEKVCKPYMALVETRAMLSIGSVSYEIVDEYSDVDIAIYYETLPPSKVLEFCRLANGAQTLNWCLGAREDGGLVESYYVHGVECQFAHTTLAPMERDIDSVLVNLDTSTPFQKALSGIIVGQPVCGEELIASYKARAAQYPRELQVAMVEKFFTFQPWWALEARLAIRDTKLWRAQALVEGAENILGALAGLNRLYYSTFQFKRMSYFINQMQHKPDELVDRLNLVIDGVEEAPFVLRQLVAECLTLIEEHLPEANIDAAKRALARSEHRWDTRTLQDGLFVSG